MPSLTKEFYFDNHERVIFLDPSIFPYPPLCTIGLTAMAVSNHIALAWSNNV